MSGVSGNMGSGTNVNNAYGNAGRGGFDGSAGGRGGYDGNAGGRWGRGGCGGSGPSGNLGQVVTTGVVVEVRGDSFDVKGNDGQVYTVGVAPCTNLNANKPAYVMNKGHEAIVKGWALQSNVVRADQVTCLDA